MIVKSSWEFMPVGFFDVIGNCDSVKNMFAGVERKR